MRKRIIAIAIGVALIAVTLIFSKVLLVRTIEEKFEVEPTLVRLGEITELSDIRLGNSIISIDEEKAKKSVMQAFPDKSVEITNIERVFPSKVIIYVKERVPSLIFERKEGLEGYAVTDGDFQINKVVKEGEVNPDDYIKVTGVEVEHSYNRTPFIRIHETLSRIEEFIPASELTKAISAIEYTDGGVIVSFKNGSVATYEGDGEAFRQKLQNIL